MRARRLLHVLLAALPALGSGCGGGTDAEEPSTLVLLHLDEGEGAWAYDASGHGLVGEISGEASWVDGTSGTGLSFEGAAAELRVDYGSVPMEASQLRLELWVKATEVDRGPSLLAGSSFNWRLQARSGAVELLIRDPAWDQWRAVAASREGVLKAGRWHEVIAEYDGRRADLYVDGALVASAAADYRLRHSDACSLFVGGSTGCCALGDELPPFRGAVDEVRLSARARTGAEDED